MSFSDFFSDEDLETQLRLQFDYEEMWDFDFRIIFSQIIDRVDDYYLEFRGRRFSIDKITGDVTDLDGGDEDE